MKKIIITVLAIVALVFTGCKDKPNAQPVSGPKDTVAGSELQPSPGRCEKMRSDRALPFRFVIVSQKSISAQCRCQGKGIVI
ncbi:MAG: hypothetical protein ABSC55_17405, partial [Syntrophorhabdales bacterium]